MFAVSQIPQTLMKCDVVAGQMKLKYDIVQTQMCI